MRKIVVILLFLLTFYLGAKELRPQHDQAYRRLSEENYKATKIVKKYNDSVQKRRLLTQINRVFEKFQSPMVGTEASLLDTFNRYGLDWRLGVGIAFKESTMGVHACGFNPFGLASCRLTFSSFEESYEYLARLLTTSNYYKKWRKTGDLYDLISVYCPVSDGCNTRLYVSQITNFMEEL